MQRHLSRVGRVGGALALQRLQRPDPRRVIYNSFNGKFSDSPRAIYEELGRRDGGHLHTWITTEADGTVPSSATTVAPYSTPYLREVGRAGTVVSNLQMPNNFHKRAGVNYLQTWHGTPLKRIGLDNDRWKRNPQGLARTTRDFARWDQLVSQNPFSTEIFRRAFGFEGEILETGYPRNDALSRPDRDEQRTRVRRALGIEDGVKAVLYAPTWRDNLVDSSGSLEFSLALDVKALGERLGDDHLLLLRLHYLLPGSLATDIVSLGGLNVSSYPDIRDLYLAADVLITDYSSAMFDFAVTGKPMVFYTYDLAEYRDEVRGFYFDLEDEAPGPICVSTDEVASALLDVDGLHEANATRYARFRERFCPFDDGRASERVIARAFGPL